MALGLGMGLRLGSRRQAAAGGGGAPVSALPIVYGTTGGNDVTVTDTNLVTVFTIPVGAGVVQVIDVIAGFTAADGTTGYTTNVTGPASSKRTWGVMSNGSGAGQGNGLVVGADDAAAVVVDGSLGATETPVLMKILVDNTLGEAGDVEIQFASESTNNVVVKAGSRAIVREATAGSTAIIMPSDVVQSSNVTYSTDMSFVLGTNKTYLIDAVLNFETAAAATGIRPRLDGIPANATVLDFRVFNNGTSSQVIAGSIRDGTESAGAASRTTPARNLYRCQILVTTTDTGGTLTIQHRSETDTSAVTVHSWSFADFRDVTDSVVITTPDNPTTDNTNYITGHSFAVEASKSYYFRSMTAYTSSAVGVGMNQRMAGIPAGATILAIFNNRGAATTGLNVTRRDGTALNNPAGPGATEMWNTAEGVIAVDTTPGTLLWEFKINDADTGTVTQETGSWSLLEEVEVAA